MKRRIASSMTGAALTAMVIGGLAVAPAFAAEKDAQMKGGATQASQSQCLKDLNKVRDDLAKDKEFRSAYTSGRFGRGNFTDLVDAARVFARNGLEERCQDVVAGIKEMAATSRQAAKSDGKDMADRKAGDTKSEKPQTTDREARREEERKEWTRRVQAAKPINQVEISAETLTGIDVRNGKGEDLGDVGDIVVANGKIEAVIIGRGGFLGIGVNHYKLTAEKARIVTLQERDGRTGDMVLILEMSDKQIESLPKVTKENGRWMAASADKDDMTDKNMKKKNTMKDADKEKKAE